MYPAAFDYHAPGTIKEALDLLGKHKDDAKLLAGGHSLIPMMKLRLAQPKHLTDLRKVPGLSGIKQDGNVLAIGAMTTHWEVESSSVVKSKLAVLSEVAALIGDPAVRNRGTVGGSIAHADPAADYPAAMIALGAEMVCEGAKGGRGKGVEAGCAGKELDAAAIEAAAQKAAEGVDVQADLQGSVEYKSHLCRVFAKRAVSEAVKRAGG